MQRKSKSTIPGQEGGLCFMLKNGDQYSKHLPCVSLLGSSYLWLPHWLLQATETDRGSTFSSPASRTSHPTTRPTSLCPWSPSEQGPWPVLRHPVCVVPSASFLVLQPRPHPLLPFISHYLPKDLTVSGLSLPRSKSFQQFPPSKTWAQVHRPMFQALAGQPH